jgi:hypothetical protein
MSSGVYRRLSGGKMAAKKGTQKSAKGGTRGKGFTDEERLAMRERARELKAASAGEADGERDGIGSPDTALRGAGSPHSTESCHNGRYRVIPGYSGVWPERTLNLLP